MPRLAVFRGNLGALVLCLALAGCGAVKSSADNPLTVGGLTPKIEDKDAGLVAIAPGLDLKKYQVVLVEKVPVSSGQIEDDGDRRFAEKVTILLHQQLVRRLRESGLFQEVVDASATEVKPSDLPALRLRGEITRLGRGSQAARYFGGIYGAGRARAQADMYFDEVPSGQVVIATADRRVSGGMQWFGGDDEAILNESFDDMARDMARFLVRLSKGQAPGTSPQLGVPRDVFLGLLFPDGTTLAFLTEGGQWAFGNISQPATFVPAFASQPIPQNLSVLEVPVEMVLPPGLIPGSYSLFLAVTAPGVLADGSFGPAELLGVGVVPLLVMPQRQLRDPELRRGPPPR